MGCLRRGVRQHVSNTNEMLHKRHVAHSGVVICHAIVFKEDSLVMTVYVFAHGIFVDCESTNERFTDQYPYVQPGTLSIVRL